MVPCLAKIHLGCSEELSREHLTIPALLPEEPETPDTPATPGDGADGDGGYTPAVTVIEDQEVPLAGLLPLHQLLEAVPIGAGTHLDGKFFVWLRQKLLKSVRIPASFFLARQKIFLANLHTVTYWYSFLEELRPHEEIPEAELPEDFKWLDHEHAQAICWGLQEQLVADTGEEPLDPDAVITVALMRDVLVNYVELYLGLDDFVVTLEGEDDEMVMDLGVRLAAFYAELETFLSAGSA